MVLPDPAAPLRVLLPVPRCAPTVDFNRSGLRVLLLAGDRKGQVEMIDRQGRA
jgi:hypothetical protein